MHPGERIRGLRREKGLTQSQLAGDVITRNMLSQIENGQAQPSMRTLEHLASVLGVTPGWLLGESDSDPLAESKQLLRMGRGAEALEAARKAGAAGDEGEILLAQIYANLCRGAWNAGHYPEAAGYAEECCRCNRKSLYASRDLELEMLWVQAQCAGSYKSSEGSALVRFKGLYEATGWEAKNHLLRAGEQLSLGNLQGAEREIWTITTLNQEDRPWYLLLRGRLALGQDKYGNAVSFLQRAEQEGAHLPGLLREVYPAMEAAYRELEDYRKAYEYAAKARAL